MTFTIINDDTEMWLDIEHYEGKYSVSNFGRVYSHIRKGRFMKTYIINSGYLCVDLCKNGIKKKQCIHALVGNAFIGKREGEMTFDHIDRNNQNNCADNIRLATRSEQGINRNIQINNKSGYKNIIIRENRYIIQIRRNKKIVFDKSYPIKDYTLEQVVEERNRFLEDYV